MTIALRFEEIIGPEHDWHKVVCSNQLGFSTVELRVLIFYLVEVVIGMPLPRDMQPPELPRMLGCVACEPIHEFCLDKFSFRRIRRQQVVRRCSSTNQPFW
jgi:hypothetical protein